MTEHEPQPVGDTLTAYRRVLARAHRAENTVRELQAELDALRGAQQLEEAQQW